MAGRLAECPAKLKTNLAISSDTITVKNVELLERYLYMPQVMVVWSLIPFQEAESFSYVLNVTGVFTPHYFVTPM